MPIKESLYDLAESRGQELKHTGFAYEGRIFEKTMSHLIFKDETRVSILAQAEAVVYRLIESVKLIKNHFNYSVPKNYKWKN